MYNPTITGTQRHPQQPHHPAQQWRGNGVGSIDPVGAVRPPLSHHRHSQYPPQPQPHHLMMQHGGRPALTEVSVRSSYRGAGPYIGSGSDGGNSWHHPPWQYGVPAFPGMGQGEIGNGGRWPHPFTPDTLSPYTAHISVMEQSSALVSVSATKLPPAPFPSVAWRDARRVDCNNFEILDQQKKHEKTMKRWEELPEQQRLMAEWHVSGEVAAMTEAEKYKVAQVGEANKASVRAGESVASESIPAAVAAKVGKVDEIPVASENIPIPQLRTETNMNPGMQLHAVGEQSETSVTTITAAMSLVDAPAADFLSLDEETRTVVEVGSKRKLDKVMEGCDKCGRRSGSKKTKKLARLKKRMRYFQTVETLVERPKEQPLCCTLCNVTCDRQGIFNNHLTGKRHMAQLRQHQGQGVVFGPIYVYVPPDQPRTSTKGQEPLYYGLTSHNTLQLEGHELFGPPVESPVHQQSDKPWLAMKTDGAALEFQADQVLEHQNEEVSPTNAGQDGVNPGPKNLNNVTGFKAERLSRVSMPLGSEAAVLDESSTMKLLPVPEYRASISYHVVLRELGD